MFLCLALNIQIFSLDASFLRKDLHVSARCKLMFPSQWETTYTVAFMNIMSLKCLQHFFSLTFFFFLFCGLNPVTEMQSLFNVCANP